ncbi:MAG: phosphatase PAP2 family protein [Nocardioidaceae bacterium]
MIDDIMTFSAKYMIFVAFAILALLALRELGRRAWGTLIRVGASLVLAFVFGLVAAQLYSEQRPFTTHHDLRVLVPHAAGQSFPSDHATASFAIAFAVWLFISRAWGVLLTLIAVLIGFARVFSGIHYPGDILGSVVVAALGVGVVVAVDTLRHRERRGRVVEEQR